MWYNVIPKVPRAFYVYNTLGTSVHNPLRYAQGGSRVVEGWTQHFLHPTNRKQGSPRDTARKREWPIGKAYEKELYTRYGAQLKRAAANHRPHPRDRERESGARCCGWGKQKEKETGSRCIYTRYNSSSRNFPRSRVRIQLYVKLIASSRRKIQIFN